MTRPARIEPRTPEGEIYTTYPFAALAVLEGNGALLTPSSWGLFPLAKGMGGVPLLALHRAAHLASEI